MIKWFNKFRIERIVVLVLFLCYLIVPGLFKEGVNLFFVYPLLSHVEQSPFLLGVVVASWLLPILIGFYRSPSFVYNRIGVVLFVGVSLIYVIDSRLVGLWNYESMQNVSFHLFDILLVGHSAIVVVLLIIDERVASFKVEQEKLSGGFINDARRSFEDHLDLDKEIKLLKRRIENTNLESCAFSVGIQAEWGDGKTHFIDRLKEKFIAEWILIEFNPWLAESPEKIYSEFFKAFRNQISKYNPKLSADLLLYSQGILKEVKASKWMQGADAMIRLLRRDATLQEHREKVNNEIAVLPKRILIIIDDVDRLNSREVWEILRLIREVAGFKNTVFVSAYDRKYVSEAIGDSNPYRNRQFLEKIFNYEHTLRIIPGEILLDALVENIEFAIDNDRFPDFPLEVYMKFETNLDSLTTFIKNFRDVKRFANSFAIELDSRVEQIDEVELMDLFMLELIKFKYPDVYRALYDNRRDILEGDNRLELI